MVVVVVVVLSWSVSCGGGGGSIELEGILWLAVDKLVGRCCFGNILATVPLPAI